MRKLEKTIDAEIVQVIAKRTPVAKDLRAVIGMSKVLVDLGRVEEKVLRVAEFVVNAFDEQTNNPPEWLSSDLRRLTTFVLEDARLIGQVIGVVLALSALERIGEYPVNLRENVIYQVTGEDVRPPAALTGRSM